MTSWADSYRLGTSAKFKGQDLNCSSIRFGEQEDTEPRTPEICPPPKIGKVEKNQRRFEENNLSNFEMSLSMSGAKDKMYELMASKALVAHAPDQASLSNTSSFDNMTMKISTVTNAKNVSQGNNLPHSVSSIPSHNNSNLHAPQQQTKTSKKARRVGFTEHYANEEMFLNVNTIQEIPNIENPQELDQSPFKTFEEQPSTHSLNENSINPPYFGAAPSFENFKPQPVVVQPVKRSPPLKTLRMAKTPQARLSSKDSKMTLRDYLYLQKLSNKKDSLSSTSPGQSRLKSEPQSPLGPLTPLTNSRCKRKKSIASAEVKQRIREEITRQIHTLESSATMARKYLQSKSDLYSGQGQVMELYALSRALHEVCKANQEVLALVNDQSK